MRRLINWFTVGFDVGGCDPFALVPSSSIVCQRADVRRETAFEFVEALASGFNFRRVTASRVNFIATTKQLRAEARQCYHPSRMARLAILPDIPSHAAQIASVSAEPFLVGGLVIIDRSIDASPEPLNSAAQVKPIKPMLNAPVQPLTGHQPHGVLSVSQNGDLGGGPTSALRRAERTRSCARSSRSRIAAKIFSWRPQASIRPSTISNSCVDLRARGFDKRPSMPTIICSTGFSTLGFSATSVLVSASIAFPTARTELCGNRGDGARKAA